VTAFEYSCTPSARRSSRLIVHVRSGEGAAGSLSDVRGDGLTSSPLGSCCRQAPRSLPALPSGTARNRGVRGVPRSATRAPAEERPSRRARDREAGSPDWSRRVRSAGWHRRSLPCWAPGAEEYLEVARLQKLDDAFFKVLIDGVKSLPGPVRDLPGPPGGASNACRSTRPAYPHRDVEFRHEHPHAVAARRPRMRSTWPERGRSSTQRVRFATGGVYVNFMPEDEGQRFRRARTVRTTSAWRSSRRSTDPQNLFRMNPEHQACCVATLSRASRGDDSRRPLLFASQVNRLDMPRGMLTTYVVRAA